MTAPTTRRRAVGADIPVRSFGGRRVCATPDCEVLLSTYNPAHHCSVHDGWDQEPRHRHRRRPPSQPLAASGSLDPRARR
jgi:hypothetical protein